MGFNTMVVPRCGGRKGAVARGVTAGGAGGAQAPPLFRLGGPYMGQAPPLFRAGAPPEIGGDDLFFFFFFLLSNIF